MSANPETFDPEKARVHAPTGRRTMQINRLPVMGLILALVAADVLMLALLGAGIIGLSPKITPERLPVHIEGLALSIAGFIVFAAASGLYNPQRAFDVRRTTPLILNTMIVVGFVLFAAFYIGQVPLTFSRLAFLVLFFGGMAALVTVRIILAAIIAYMLAGGYAAERLLLVAFRDDFTRFKSAVAVGTANRMQVTSVLRPDDPHAEDYLRGHIKALDVEAIVFLTRPGDNIENNALFIAAQRSPLSCYVALPHADFPGEILKAMDEGSHILLQTSREAISGWGAIQKRALDVTVSLFGLILTSPLLLVAMIAIRLESRGPVIFRQTRYGYNNQPFTILKLRSMRAAPANESGVIQTGDNDPRVTRVGRIIRRLKIDELPQLVNVLKGDMSLVGPRAHATKTDLQGLSLEAHETRYLTRHNVRPGLTSWAIVNGCTGAMDSVEKLRETVDYDLHYIRHWSVWLDLTILAMTLVMLVAERSVFSGLRRKRGS
ncbi:MAG TPA: exopolysaccharide biosynthesis polyprenyl glycosylphosphotransferase [Micropepsaceae bacterium]|nr:exopolysaccharide biosynthesis polyprenyl glycosylphosphotransferase [Micropepsaceae bacterium]